MLLPKNIEAEISRIITNYPDKRSALLPVLHIVKEHVKTFTPEVVTGVAERLEIEPIEIWDVLSFYTLYPREEEGRYVIQVCSTLSCALMGSESIVDYLRQKLGIDVGETTADRKFTLKKVECLGSCGTAPVMQINDDYYENLTREKIDEILANLE